MTAPKADDNRQPVPPQQQQPPEEQQHYGAKSWREFARGHIASEDLWDAMSVHLDVCETCAQAYESQPRPPYTCYGRPLTPPAADPVAMEPLIENLIAMIEGGIASRRSVVLAGEGVTESPLLHMLAVALARLRKRRPGLKSNVQGTVYDPSNGRVAPEYPAAGKTDAAIVPVLLEAPAYPVLGPWRSNFAVFTGHVRDWRWLDIEPDWICPAMETSGGGYPKLLLKSRIAIEECLERGEPQWAARVAARGALGFDTPVSTLAEDQRELPDVAAELTGDGNWPLPWVGVACGNWTAREIVAERHLPVERPSDVPSDLWERAWKRYRLWR